MIATSTMKFTHWNKGEIMNGEDEESKSIDQSDMPRIRSTSGKGVLMESGFLKFAEKSQEDNILLFVDKDRYIIHGFYNKISVVNRPNTRCVSAVSILLGYGCWLNHLKKL
ncbi:hypothetical protein Bca4012_066248 [Brassica carinata]